MFSIMEWGAIGIDHKGPLIIIRGDLDAAGYIEMLKRDLLDTLIASITGGRGYVSKTERHRTLRQPA
jgi:hypothetical protein